MQRTGFEDRVNRCRQYLRALCEEITDRSVGSNGNREATGFFWRTAAAFGWDIETQEFAAIDWEEGEAGLAAGGEEFTVRSSPYSPGGEAAAELVGAATTAELEEVEMEGKILLLSGEIAREQLLPKNFVFYNPPGHRKIIALLEAGRPAALVCATGKNPALAGGLYPFPLIEDGDFDIPSVYMTDIEGERLRFHRGKKAVFKSGCRRIPSFGENVIARRGRKEGGRIVVTAHIDSKKGTPGALDNAGGVTVLLLLAELLKDYTGSPAIELTAFNGEDYYSVPGQMCFLEANRERFDEILFNINIDGAGYREGGSAFSFYGLPEEIEKKAREIFKAFDGLGEGKQWPQGDHSIFIQNGCPAIAFSSRWFTEDPEALSIVHTPSDNLGIVDCRKLVEITGALDYFLREMQGHVGKGYEH